MSSFFVVTKKELQDNFNSWRFLVMLFIMLASIVYVFYSANNIKASASNGLSDFVFLQLFTTTSFNISNSLVPTSFLTLMSILLPVAGIVLGLDAINSEKNDGRQSRLVSQRIYRDNIINAKFVAGLLTIAIVLVSTVLLVGAMGMFKLGVVPSAEEILRIIFFLIIGIIYGGFWLALSILFSTLFRQTAVSAIISIIIFIFFAFFYPLIYNSIAANADTIETAQRAINVALISPVYMFNEAMSVALVPIMRSSTQLFTLFTTDAGNYMLATPLSVWQSFLAVWIQVIITIVLMVVCFAVSYIKFMFEEIRSL